MRGVSGGVTSPAPVVFADRKVAWAVTFMLIMAASIWAFLTGPLTEQRSSEPGVRVDASGAYNPVLAGEPLPDGFRQLLPRDAIQPIYDPVFVRGVESPWPGDTDVIGVRVGDEAKAYPVDFLGGRELVIDELDGIPILVSW